MTLMLMSNELFKWTSAAHAEHIEDAKFINMIATNTETTIIDKYFYPEYSGNRLWDKFAN